jgi:hypothetical protein
VTSQRPKHGYGRAPAKGTKSRQLLLMLLRPQGATTWELVQAGLLTRNRSMGQWLIQLEDQKGYDIRSFPLHERTLERVGPVGMTSKRPPLVYKLLGRWTWDRRFRPYSRFWD